MNYFIWGLGDNFSKLLHRNGYKDYFYRTKHWRELKIYITYDIEFSLNSNVKESNCAHCRIIPIYNETFSVNRPFDVWEVYTIEPDVV